MQALLLLSEGGEGPNTELLWLLGILLGFFALSIVVGWVKASMGPKQAEVESEAPQLIETGAPVASQAKAKSVKSGRRNK